MAKPINIFTDPIHKTPESYREYRNQAEYIIEYLREFPNGRWGVATLWNPAELKGMNLVPCCHTSTWNLDGGRLNCVLDQRSGDMPYGVPFNATQYAELMCMIAKELGVKPGILTHVIADAHIYANQMDGVAKQICQWELMNAVVTAENSPSCFSYMDIAYAIADKLVDKYKDFRSSADLIYHCKDVLKSVPHFEIHSDAGFFEYAAEECAVEDYKYISKVNFGDVAV